MSSQNGCQQAIEKSAYGETLSLVRDAGIEVSMLCLAASMLFYHNSGSLAPDVSLTLGTKLHA